MKRAARIVAVLCFLISSLTLAAVITTGGGNVAVYEPVRASFVAGQFGAALENEANFDTNTVMFCATDHPDGATSTPQCALSGVRHQGVNPGNTTANYFGTGAAADQTKIGVGASGEFHQCAIVKPTSFAALQIIFMYGSLETAPTDTGYFSNLVQTTGKGSVTFIDGAGVSTTLETANAATLNATNILCWGRDAVGNGYLKLNDGATVDGAVTGAPVPDTEVAYLGVGYVGGGLLYPFSGVIYELNTSSTAASDALFIATTASTMACRSAGRCLPSAAGDRTYYNGDSYLVGGNWANSTGTETLSAFGQIQVAKGRYNWPSLAWAMTGTVPRVTQTAVMNRGLGPKQEHLTGFNGANYLSYTIATSPSVFTECVRSRRTQGYRVNGDAGTSLDTILAHTTGTTGWTLTSTGTAPGVLFLFPQPFVFSWYDSGGTLRSVATTATSTQDDHSVCFGHDGSKGWVTADNDTPVSGTFDYGKPANGTAMVYGGATAGTAYVSEFKEIFASSTSPTSPLLKMLASTPCTAPGNCFPAIANEELRCNARDYDLGAGLLCSVNDWGGTWATTGTLVKGSSASTKTVENRDADAAGPFSDANYFTLGTGADVLDFAGDFSCCAAYNPVTTNATRTIAANGVYNASGWIMGDNGTVYLSGAGTVATVLSANTLVGAENIICWGAVGGSPRVKQNGGTYVTTASTVVQVPATAVVAELGRYTTGGAARNLSGNFNQLWCSSTPASDALFTKIQRRFLGATGTQDQPITVTRTTSGSANHVGGKVTFPAPNTPILTPAHREKSVMPAELPASLPTHDATPPGYRIHAANTNEGRVLRAATAFDLINTTATDNAALAPDGTMTAVAVRETVALDVHRAGFYLAFGAGGGWMDESSFYVRPVGDRFIVAYNTTDFVNLSRFGHYPVDWANAGIGGTTAATNIGHEHLADGWVRIWLVSTTGYLYVNIADATLATSTYTGDVTKGYDIWGGQHTLPASDHYSAAPFCDNRGLADGVFATCNADVLTIANPLRPNGSDWTNLALQSEDIGTTWTNSATTETVNAVIAPDGSFTADLLAEDDANSEHYLTQTYTATAAPWTCSVYAKQGTRHHVEISTEAGTTGNYFDLTTCSVGTAVGAGVTAAATTEANGWCRVAVTHTMGAGATSVRAYLADADNSNSYDGTAGLGLYLWGWQCEAASAPSAYCPTLAAARSCGPGGATGKVTSNRMKSASESLSNWVKWEPGVATVAVSDADAACPIGPRGVRMNLVTVSNSLDDAQHPGVQVSYTGTTPPATVRSAFLARPTAAANCNVLFSQSNIGVVHAESTYTLTGTPTLITNYIDQTKEGLMVLWLDTATGCTQFCIDAAQLEPGTAASGGYCPTTTDVRMCAIQQRWCVRVKDATPLNGRAWTPGGATGRATLISTGSNATVPGFYELMVYGDGKVYSQLGNAAGAYINASVAHAFAAGSTHTIIACGFDGVLSLTFDGVTQAVTTATSTLPNGLFSTFLTPLSVGSETVGGTASFWNGTIGSVEFNSTGSPKDFSP